MQTIHSVIPDNYVLSGGVYVRPGAAEGFGYNDGDGVEEHILQVLTAAEDLGTGSEYLHGQICDWPTQYHFSPQRADLLRPFASRFSVGQRVLEIGSGCGAITRFLGECGASVTALEGSGRRAQITATRCRDLEHVTVVHDTLSGFSDALSEADGDFRFDCVTLIGVLEYSQLYGGGAAGPLTMLRKCLDLLTEDGLLFVAIENKLGLKYWAGVPEDHVGMPYTGIEDRYEDGGRGGATPVTFGKEELRGLLDEAGYGWSDFYFPFPDYKMPSVILPEAGLDGGLNVVNLLRPVLEGGVRDAAFYFPRTIGPVVANGLLGALSNSFLVVAGGGLEFRYRERALGYTFNSLRKRAYTKTNVFVRQADHEIAVRRLLHFPEAVASDDLPVRQQLDHERYVPGRLYSLGLADILTIRGWGVGDVAVWAKPYYALLKVYSVEQEEGPVLPGRFADLTPFNILEGRNGLEVIDLEWIYEGMLPREYVLFRGLYHCLVRMPRVFMPASGTPLNVFSLIIAVMEQLGIEPQGRIQDFIAREGVCFGALMMGGQEPVDVELTVFGDGMRGAPVSGEMPLYPLKDLHVQVFAETDNAEFCEALSLKYRLELSASRRVHVLHVADHTGRLVRLRIDPSDRPGLIQVHAVTIRTVDGHEIFHWTPFSRSHTWLSGVMIIHPSPQLPEPVFILTDYDPMMIFSLSDARPFEDGAGLIVELELSTVPEHHFVHLKKLWQQLYG